MMEFLLGVALGAVLSWNSGYVRGWTNHARITQAAWDALYNNLPATGEQT